MSQAIGGLLREVRHFTMPQTRTTFLDIPAEVRERIFLYADLISGAVIQLCHSSRRAYRTDIPQSHFRFTYNILQTCKTVYAQVKSILFARNSILVHHRNVEGGLEILRSLSREQCRSLRHLFVHLHVEDAIPDRGPWLKPEQIAAWQTTARQILSRIEPGMLKLYLISDTGDSQETRAVCQPLLEFPGKLKDCRLRLGSTRQHRLSILALDTVTRIQGGDPDVRKRPFRFPDLPFEIRRQILEYTDLVTPYNQVQWNSSRGFHGICDRCHCGLQHGEICHSRFHWFGWYTQWDSIETGPFCRRRRSVYSSDCYCWSPPDGLMLASRAVYQEAMSVFYSCNYIVVTPSEDVDFRVCSLDSQSRLDASRFITRHKWPGVLRYLRSLELVLPAVIPASCPEISSSLYLDWRSAISHLKAHANLANLTVVVHTSLSVSRHLLARNMPSDLTAESTLEARARLLTPLQALRQMKRFFVYLEWSWHWTPSYLESLRMGGRVNHEREHGLVVEMETWLERVVMGNSYDSLAVGKADEEPSDWARFELDKYGYM
ncbi:hypothetical protein F4820DRAFT_415137 [Hypoxylon rubiginosum]|uniref:Uncharacterized protein n=1 Tax=Hypoxylon rubiginosum TaxID=110542 RepID=A0ACB9Z6R7_9PEZI|nr:hypothetical protein F4820DRAFT_415137 [Hypoxylon rubiginosum]